ncbi:MAG: hypothetical protein N3I86_12140, partial [Verrucomicrobiae bacterium]|nr:hypothetical protein [Verrucomicrobiae bacterium]
MKKREPTTMTRCQTARARRSGTEQQQVGAAEVWVVTVGDGEAVERAAEEGFSQEQSGVVVGALDGGGAGLGEGDLASAPVVAAGDIGGGIRIIHIAQIGGPGFPQGQCHDSRG